MAAATINIDALFNVNASSLGDAWNQAQSYFSGKAIDLSLNINKNDLSKINKELNSSLFLDKAGDKFSKIMQRAANEGIQLAANRSTYNAYLSEAKTKQALAFDKNGVPLGKGKAAKKLQREALSSRTKLINYQAQGEADYFQRSQDLKDAEQAEKLISRYSGTRVTGLQGQIRQLKASIRAGTHNKEDMKSLIDKINEYDQKNSPYLDRAANELTDRKKDYSRARYANQFQRYGKYGQTQLSKLSGLYNSVPPLTDANLLKKWFERFDNAALEAQTFSMRQAIDRYNKELTKDYASIGFDNKRGFQYLNSKQLSSISSQLQKNIISNTLTEEERKSDIQQYNQLLSLSQIQPKLDGLFGRMSGDFKNAILSGLNIAGLSQLLNRAMSTIANLDKATANLQIASGVSKQTAGELMTSYNDMAMDLGTTTMEVATSAAEWMRQGYSIEQTKDLVQSSTMLSKLGYISSSEATGYLTSMLKGFKLDSSDAESIVDKLVTVDMQAAVSSGQIAESLSRAAVSSSIAGIDLDTLIGYATTIQETTQASSSIVGTGLRSMIARMGQIKSNKLVDTETQEDISNVEIVLNDLGIKLRETGADWRDFDDVLGDVHSHWDKYSDTERRAIANAFAGTRNQENFLVLMENYDQAMKYASISANSTGNAANKYSIYQNSYEAKMNKVSASFEKLSTTFFSSDTFGSLADMASGLIDGLSKVTGFFGANGMTGILGGLSVSPAMRNFALSTVWNPNKSSSELNTFYENISKAYQNYQAGNIDQKQYNNAYEQAYSGLTTKAARNAAANINPDDENSFRLQSQMIMTQSFGSQLKNFASGIGMSVVSSLASAAIGWAASKIFESFYNAAHADEIALKDASASVDQATEKLNTFNQNVSDYQSQIDELESKKSTTGLTTEESEQLTTLRAKKTQAEQDAEQQEIIVARQKRAASNLALAQLLENDYSVDYETDKNNQLKKDVQESYQMMMAAIPGSDEYSQAKDIYTNAYDSLMNARAKALKPFEGSEELLGLLDITDEYAMSVKEDIQEAKLAAEEYFAIDFDYTPNYMAYFQDMPSYINRNGRDSYGAGAVVAAKTEDNANFNNLAFYKAAYDEEGNLKEGLSGFNWAAFQGLYGDLLAGKGNSRDPLSEVEQKLMDAAVQSINDYLENNDVDPFGTYVSDYLSSNDFTGSKLDDELSNAGFKDYAEFESFATSLSPEQQSSIAAKGITSIVGIIDAAGKLKVSQEQASDAITISIQSITSAYSSLNTAMEQQADIGYLTQKSYNGLADTFVKLGATAEDVWKSIDLVDGQMQLNVESVFDLAKQYSNAKIEELQYLIADKKVQLQLAQTSGATEDEINKLRSDIVLYEQFEQQLIDSSSALAKWNAVRSQGNTGDIYRDNVMKTMNNDIKNGLKDKKTGKGNRDFWSSVEFIFGRGYDSGLSPTMIKQGQSALSGYFKNEDSAYKQFLADMKKGTFDQNGKKQSILTSDGTLAEGVTLADIARNIGISTGWKYGTSEDFARYLIGMFNEREGVNLNIGEDYSTSYNKGISDWIANKKTSMSETASDEEKAAAAAYLDGHQLSQAALAYALGSGFFSDADKQFLKDNSGLELPLNIDADISTKLQEALGTPEINVKIAGFILPDGSIVGGGNGGGDGNGSGEHEQRDADNKKSAESFEADEKAIAAYISVKSFESDEAAIKEYIAKQNAIRIRDQQNQQAAASFESDEAAIREYIAKYNTIKKANEAGAAKKAAAEEAASIAEGDAKKKAGKDTVAPSPVPGPPPVPTPAPVDNVTVENGGTSETSKQNDGLFRRIIDWVKENDNVPRSVGDDKGQGDYDANIGPNTDNIVQTDSVEVVASDQGSVEFTASTPPPTSAPSPVLPPPTPTPPPAPPSPTPASTPAPEEKIVQTDNVEIIASDWGTAGFTINNGGESVATGETEGFFSGILNWFRNNDKVQTNQPGDNGQGVSDLNIGANGNNVVYNQDTEGQEVQVHVTADTSDALSEIDAVTGVDPVVKVVGEADMSAANSAIDSLPSSIDISVNFNVGNMPEIPGASGANGAFGTAKSSGTAYAEGSWGTKSSGTDLVGELGQELVVDPSNGTWHTVGDNGAEFTNIPKGAIVFNHKQTEEILKNRKINSRGTALVNGNAFVDSPSVAGQLTSKISKTKGTKKKTSKKSSKAKEIIHTHLSENYKWVDYENMFAEQTDEWFDRQIENINDASSRIDELREHYQKAVDAGMKLSSKKGQAYNEALVKADQALFEMKKKNWEEQNERDKKSLEYLKQQTEGAISVKDSHYELTKTIREESKELKKEYEIARDAIPYLSEAQKQTLFSKEDYETAVSKLNDIAERSKQLEQDYLQKISETSEDEVYLIDTLTKEYQNQLDLLGKEYSVTKSSLALEKQKKELENAKSNKNVAILQNGQWTWTYDYQTVKDAIGKVSDAEYDFETATSDYQFQQEKTDLTTYVNKLTEQINTIENMVFSLDEVAKEVHELTDALRNALPKFANGGVNTTTGAAIMHGTANNPEVVFNSAAASKLYSFVQNVPDISSYITDSIIGQLDANVGKSFNANNGTPQIQPTNDNRVYIQNIEVPEQYADQFLSLLRSMMSLY